MEYQFNNVLSGLLAMDLFTTIMLLLGIVVLIFILVLIYSGILHSPDIQRIPSPYPKMTIAYRFNTGPYNNCGYLFCKTCTLAPNNNCLGIYYDNCDVVPESDLRWAVGSVVAEGDETPDSELVKTLQENGYKIKILPKVKEILYTWYPFRTRLSIYLAIYTVWTKLGKYIKKSECHAYPWVEIYTPNKIHYIGILDQHQAFYVDEARKLEVEREKAQEDSYI